MAGLRVLVVEDEFLLAMMLEDTLNEEGCIIVGPFGRVAEAIQAATEEQIDLAVLDVNVAGEKVFPVADLLDRSGVPFILLTGYGEKAVPQDRQHWQTCDKPYRPEQLIEVLLKKAGSRRPG
jgi:CheY-like chemotaxis protein